MAGCELNIAHNAFVAAPPAHRLRHDVIVTSADDFDASRRRGCVEDDDETEADRDGMIPHYRLVPNAFGPGGGGEWVTLSKSVLLQLVERICQLSFQTDNLTAAAANIASPSTRQPSDRFETSADVLADAVKSTGTSSVDEAERPCCLSPLLTGATSDDATAASEDIVDISNTDSARELTADGHGNMDDVSTSDTAFVASDDTDVVPSQEFDVDRATRGANFDDDEDDSDVFTGPVAMQEDVKTQTSPSLAESPPPMSMSPDIAVPDDITVAHVAPLAETRKSPSPTTSLRSHADRRRRLRELRRLRRHRQIAVTAADDQSRDRCRDRRRDAIVRRRFAAPRQLPPRFHDRQIADVEHHPDVTTDASSPMRLPVGCRYGRVFQPWSALNKVVICQLVDVVLSQELASTTTSWRSAAASSEKQRSSAVIWNPAITPETRECRNPTPPRLSRTVNDLSSLASPSSAECASSTLLHSLLSPMAAAAAAATTYLRSDMSAADAEVSGSSLAWTMSQSSSGRRRHHSAAASDTLHVPWTSPSFFWYNVPPSQGNFFLLPDAAATHPCCRWIGTGQPATLPPTCATADGSALDYRAQTLDAGGCPDAVDNQARAAAEAAASGHPGPPRRRGSQPSTPSASVASRRGSGARLKWVVVNKTDVCSLFESLASSMVADGDEKRTSSEQPSYQSASTVSGTPISDQASRAVTGEPIKWKSTLLRRARAEAHTPKLSGSEENTRVSFTVDC